MTVSIYDIARHQLGTAQLHWAEQQMLAAIPILGYQPALDIHTYISVAQPFRAPISLVSNQAVHPAGWWQCDPITFPEAPINEPLDTIIIYRQTDGLLVLAVTFPTITPTKASPIEVLYGINALGICRP